MRSKQRHRTESQEWCFRLVNDPIYFGGKEVKVMMTNSNSAFIRELYAPFARNTIEINSTRAINCKASKRQGHTDLIIGNYNL